MEGYLLGIDVGTSAVKVVLFDLQGKVVAATNKTVPIYSEKPDYAEQNMNEIWDITTHSIAMCLAESRIDPTRIVSIGVTGQGTGCWLLDESLQPLGNAVIWIDGRAKSMLDEWKKDGRHLLAFERSSNSIFTGSPVAVLGWLKEEKPEILRRAKHFLFAKDWIRYKLTGVLATDASDFCMFPLSLDGEVHSILEIFGLEELEEIFPPMREAWEVVGTVTREAASCTGLRVGTPVVTGVVDVAACALALGVLCSGQAYSILGTTCFNAFLTERSSALFEPPGVGISVFYPLKETFLRAMATMSGTLSLDWFLTHVLRKEKEFCEHKEALFVRLEEEVRQIPPGAEGLVFLPYISPGGERAPFVDPRARGVFFGLSYAHRDIHLARAVYEGISFSVLDCFQSLAAPFQEMRLSGGGAKSNFWCQMVADMTGVKVVVPRVRELGALGVALLAGVGVDVFADLHQAVAETFQVDRIFYPDSSLHQFYREKFLVYRKLREALGVIWEINDKIQEKIPFLLEAVKNHEGSGSENQR
ncbi:MAG: FGGY-family carbohydrate kinase [Atribacterota bacterium]